MNSGKIKVVYSIIILLITLSGCGVGKNASENAFGTSSVSGQTLNIINFGTDFSDGEYGFLGIDKWINPSSDNSLMLLSEFDGTNAVKISGQGSDRYIAIQMDAMVGDRISEVATMAITVAVRSEDGNFYAVSGYIYEIFGGKKADDSDWSIYKESINPKMLIHHFSSKPAEGDYVVISLENDVAEDEGIGQQDFYILDITFLDESGNVIPVNTLAEFVPLDNSEDLSNLFGITQCTDAGISTKSCDAWTQTGGVLPEEALERLYTPGSVITIDYSSVTGNMWVVFPEADESFGDSLRIGYDENSNDNDYLYYNSSKNKVQITYEQIASVLGEDTSLWGNVLMCESDGNYSINSVTISLQAPNYCLADALDCEIAVSGAEGWSQYGASISEDAVAAICEPGSIIEIKYFSESGECWIVFPDAGVGWSRIGVGDLDNSGSEYAQCDGNTCYITYEQIAAVLGEDTDDWFKYGSRIQIEASTIFDVYSVRVGRRMELMPNNRQIDIGISGEMLNEGTCIGTILSDEAYEALIAPGSIINISYSSEDGECMAVFSDASQSETGSYIVRGEGDGNYCQITYDMIVAGLGEDTSLWGRTLEIEALSSFSVYAVTIGQTE